MNNRPKWIVVGDLIAVSFLLIYGFMIIKKACVISRDIKTIAQNTTPRGDDAPCDFLPKPSKLIIGDDGSVTVKMNYYETLMLRGEIDKWLDGPWVPVTPDKVLYLTLSPDGSPIAWSFRYDHGDEGEGGE